ncbi:hypothetical protein [Parvimonas micra]|uniref:Uncharacterized protein n=1 Tax=Parvimonas micra ATCC 33270 TaxID=411465 RepID=A8SKQ3_9FIRM|nr:hypothetical protein [Parvimonas micra]EDP24167.1 hypothetical protein PEPMIC_00747 [Parvimonas micra ATCC 33270]RSB90427.1 hypothetical protein EGS00_01260 [Parvimonas micra]VEH96947.1 Uncharacterised protein [Parvimonas micra]
MATSGSFRSSWRGYTLVTNWECTQNHTHNFSDINVELYLETQSGYDLYVGARTHTVEIDGSSYSISNSSIRIGGGSSKYLGYVSKRVYHEDDGTKTINISSYFDMRATIRGTYKNGFGGSETFELTKIPRMSSVSDIMDGSRELGTKHTIHIKKQLSGNITHTVWYLLRGDKGSSQWYYIAKNTDKLDLDFIPTTNHIELQPENETIYMDIGIDTFKDGVKIGSTSYNTDWHMKVPKECIPIINSISINDINPKTKALGVYVQNHSKLNIKTDAVGVSGSTIKNVLVEFENVKWTGSNITSSEIENYGDIKVKVIVKDTRDRIATQTKTIKVEEYFAPTINEFNGDRLENELKVVSTLINFKTASLNSKNKVKWELSRKRQDHINWTTINSGTEFSLNRNERTVNVSEDYEYDLKLSVTDFNETVEKIIRIYTTFSIIDYHNSGTGLAFGKSSTKPGIFDCDLPAEFNKPIYVEKIKRKEWTKMHLYNSTKPYDIKNELKYTKDSDGTVFIQGIVKDTVSEWLARITREDCRPQKDLIIFVPCTNYKSAILKIYEDGNIIIENRSEISTNWISLDGITFKAKD